MTPRRLLAVGAILAIISLVVVLRRNGNASSPVRSLAPQLPPAANSVRQEATGSPSEPSQSPHSAAPARKILVGQPALFAPRPEELSTTERPPLGNLIGAPNTRPDAEPQLVLDVLKAYRRYFGAYPAGENNRQFVNALLGANKDNLPFLAHDHPRISANGELVDAWGTPFYFHQNSRQSIEVRSAGADRLLYTDDDIVAGGPSSSQSGPSVAADNPPNG